MHEEAGFLSVIRQSPADNTARLVFADWLDEQDDPNCKIKADFIRLELHIATTEQGLTRLRWSQRLQNLAVQIAPRWLAVVSRPRLESCRMSLGCPNQWEQLTPTDDAKVRFCAVCKKGAHYCETLQEAQNYAANGDTIAVTPALVRWLFDRPPQPGPPKYLAPPRRLRRIALSAIRRSAPGRTPLPVRASHINEPISPILVVERVNRPVTNPPTTTEETPEQTPTNDSPQWEPDPQTESYDNTGRKSRQQKRQKGRNQNRNIERENWEETD